MPLYFAYDEFMDPALATSLIADIRVVGIGRLPRHRIVIAAEGRATVARDPRRHVEGMLFEISLAGLRLWDRRFRGVTKINQPIISVLGPKRALLHIPALIMEPDIDPRRLLNAARNVGLSAAYCAEIEIAAAGMKRHGARHSKNGALN